MAILNNLIVRGATRCLNTLYANSLQTDSQTISGNLTVNGYTYMGYSTSRSDTKLSVAGITNNQWYRSSGAVGWYNDSYGGGVYMSDSTYVKTYNDKAFYAHNGLYTGASGQYYLNLNGKLNAADGVISNVLNVGNSIIARNVSVTNTLRAAKYDLQTVTQMGTNGTLYVAPSIQFPTSNTTSVTTASTSITIIDTNITSDVMAGVVWRPSAKVKISGTINGVVTGTVDGTITSINTSSKTMVIGNLSGGNWSSVVAGTYTKDKIENLNIMMYETYQNSTYYPVGILLTSYGSVSEHTDGTAKTFIDIYGGSATKPAVRLGNMTGLDAINGVTPSGWGLYTSNGYFSGLIVSTSGKIGGWSLSTNSLTTGTWGSSGSAMLCTGSTTQKAIGGSPASTSGWVFTAGENFGVTSSGALYANSAHISGEITATSGTIGGFQVDNTAIHTKNVEITSNADNSIALSSADFTRTINNTSRTGLRLAIGDKFGVTGDGTVYASNVDLTGKITATSGTIGGIEIENGALKVSSINIGNLGGVSNYAQKDYVDDAVDNIEIGGRNLLKNSNVENTSLTKSVVGGTATQTIPSGTVITLSVQVDADDVVWASSGNKRIGVTSSIVKDSGENQYIEAWAAMTGRTGTGIDKTFDTSFHGRVKSTYTLQGELPLDKAFNLHIQSVTSGTVSVSRPKLEIGNKATDWTPAPEDIEEEVSNLRTDLQTQIDEKIQTYYQSTAPSWSSATDRAKHNGDLWYCTESDPYTEYEAKNVYRYDSASNTWVEYSATSELFDKVDGKSTIFYGTTSDTFTDVDTGDYLVDSGDGSSYRWDGSKWVKVTDYKTAIDNIEVGGRNLLRYDVKNYGVATFKIAARSNCRGMYFPCEGNQTYTISRKQVEGNRFWIVTTTEEPVNGLACDIIFDEDDSILKHTFTTPSTAKYVFIYLSNESDVINNGNIKAEKGNKATDWTPAPEDIQDGIDHAQDIANVALFQSVEYIIGTQTAVTGSWTGISNTINELKDGTQIRYWLPHAGSGNATLNLTLANGTTTGAIPIYRQGGYVSNGNVVANRVTTHFPTGSVVSMTYGVDRSISVVSSGTTYTGLFTGWFADGAYDSGNTINRVRLQNVITAETAITAGHIICGTANGYKNIGANVSFDLSYPLLYASSAITASKTGDNNYLSINGVSATSNGTVQSGAAKKTLYLKGKVTGNMFKISASPFMTTTQPTTDDGYYYIPLGIMYSTIAIYFQSSNRLYAYIDGAFQPVDTAAVLRAEEAKKVATNYLSMDSTGIMVADMNDGEQKPSKATGRNVFIDNDSVDIRNGTLTLASFTGDNTKFYDPVYKKELATFGTGGAIIGANNEQRFVIEKDSVSAINENGAPVFSIVSTNKTFETEAEAAPAGQVGAYISGSTITLDAGDSVSGNTFYIRNISVIIGINHSSSILNNVKVNSVNANAIRIDYYDGSGYISTPDSKHSIVIPESPAFSCNYGVSKTATYEITASFINDYNDSYNLICNFTLTYDGQRTLDLSVLEGSCTRTSGNNEKKASFNTFASKYTYSPVISSMAYTKAPAMTFGTRNGEDGMLSSVFGQGLYAEKEGEFVIGRFNEQELQTESKYAFVVGNGEAEEHRSNALTIDWSGNICFGIDVAGLDVDAELATAIINAGWDDDVYDD